MAFQAFPVDRFGGLKLSSDPEEIGPASAIDLLDVDLDRQGRLRSRDGYAQLTTVEGTNRYDSLTFFDRASGTKYLVAGAGIRLESINSAGAVVHSSSAPTGGPHYFARFGSPTAEYVYIANGLDQIRRYDGTSFTNPAGLGAQTGRFIAVKPSENRLVHARTSTNTSRVAFSDAGAAETFTAANYVDITPGDGEEITALIAWSSYLLAFKKTKFAVFSDSATDATGNPIFNYRLVDTGIGCAGYNAVCATPEGVYFAAGDGIYVTTGGPPRYVSGAIEPLFRGQVPWGYGGSYITNVVGMTYIEGRVIIHAREYNALLAPLTSPKVLVYDTRSGDWSAWNLPMVAMTSARWSATARPYLTFAYDSGLKHLGQMTGLETTDAGAAISWRWQSGWFDMGQPTVKKFTRWTRLWGSGAPTLSVFTDMSTTDALAGAVTLGTSPAVAEGYRNQSYGGVMFSHKLSGSGPAVVNRMVHEIAGARP